MKIFLYYKNKYFTMRLYCAKCSFDQCLGTPSILTSSSREFLEVTRRHFVAMVTWFAGLLDGVAETKFVWTAVLKRNSK